MTIGERFSLDICSDCLLDLANGECGNEEQHGCLNVDQRGVPVDWPDWTGYNVAIDCCGEDDCGYFSWSSCDYCGSTLGGDRHRATAWTRGKTNAHS